MGGSTPTARTKAAEHTESYYLPLDMSGNHISVETDALTLPTPNSDEIDSVRISSLRSSYLKQKLLELITGILSHVDELLNSECE